MRSVRMPVGIYPPNNAANVLDLATDAKRDFGASGSGQSTTGGIAAGSPVLSLASALDFSNGQGITVLGAGPASTLPAPATPTVTPTGGTGTATWAYVICAVDSLLGLSPASTAGSTSTGVTSLGGQAGSPPFVYNALSWSAVAGATAYAIYRTTTPSGATGVGGASLANGFIGIVYGTSFNDVGVPVQTPPDTIPANPPASATAQKLITTILSGGGTATLTLAANAGTTVSGATVRHNDGPSLAAAFAAAVGKELYIPTGTYVVDAPNPIVFGTQNAFNGTRIVFAQGAVIQFNGLGTLLAIQGNGSSGTGSSNFVLDAPNIVHTLGNAILIADCALFSIRRLQLSTSPGMTGLTLSDTYTASIGIFGISGNTGNPNTKGIVFENGVQALRLYSDGGGQFSGYFYAFEQGVTGSSTLYENNTLSGLVFEGGYCNLHIGQASGLEVGSCFGENEIFAWMYIDETASVPGGINIHDCYVSLGSSEYAIYIRSLGGVLVQNSNFTNAKINLGSGGLTSPAGFVPNTANGYPTMYMSPGSFGSSGVASGQPNPVVSGTRYAQVSTPTTVMLYLPVYATTPGTAGSVSVAWGINNGTPATVFSKYVSGNTSSSNPDVLMLPLPFLCYWKITASGVTFGTPSYLAFV